MIYDEEDDGKSDQSDSDDTSEDDDDVDMNVVLPGYIIWELHGGWHWYVILPKCLVPLGISLRTVPAK